MQLFDNRAQKLLKGSVVDHGIEKLYDVSRFLDDLRRHEGLLEEFDEKLWLATVDFVIVHSESKMTVRFKDGMEILVDTETRSGPEKPTRRDVLNRHPVVFFV